METQMKKYFTKKRIYAILTIFVIIANMFSPYSVLAAAPADGEPYFTLVLEPIQDISTVDESDWTDATWKYYFEYYQGQVDTPEESTTHVLTVNLRINGTNVNTGCINLQFDNSKITPAYEDRQRVSGKWVYYMAEAETFEDFAVSNWGNNMVASYDTSTSVIRLDGSNSSYVDDGFIAATFTFILNEGVTLDDLTTDMFNLIEIPGMLEGGLELDYFPNTVDMVWVNGSDYLLFEGFAESNTKKVDSILIKTEPTKNKYYNTEALDFTGGVIEVTYDDDTTEEVTITDAITAGTLKVDSTTANNTTKKVTLTYEGKDTEFKYYVLDSINVKTPLTNMNYEHNDTIDFAGGELNAAYTNSDNTQVTETINIANSISSGNLTVDKTKANVDDKNITYTYNGKQTTMELTVTDPVVSIKITPPTDTQYNSGETINLAGGKITPITKSGKSLTSVSAEDSSVTASTLTADINATSANDRWEVTGGDGLQAGYQNITLTYEGCSADFVITVNDTVSGISITTQPTAKNKYGTSAGALDFTGLVATVTTTGGGSFTVGPNALNIDTSKYNSNSLDTQEFTVSYGTITSSNKAQIKLSNYITGIDVTFSQTTFDYGTSLSDIAANGKYVEKYADGTNSDTKSITTNMISGYVATPAASLFNSSHTYDETLTITLATSSNSFDLLPATHTQVITIRDVVDNITVLNKPNKITYNYGETFSETGGLITVNYKSGASSSVSMSNSNITLTETDGSTIDMSPELGEFTNGTATKEIKVTYTDNGNKYDATFNITIKDEVETISITTDPVKVFNHGDDFTAENGKLTVKYKSTNSEVIDLEKAFITETDGSEINMSPDISEYKDNISEKTLKVEYGGAETTYTITIINTVTKIEIQGTAKPDYNRNEEFQNNLSILVYREVGDPEPVTVTKDMLTNFNTSTDGTRTATITYEENGTTKTATFEYTVADKITSIEVQGTLTNPTYLYGHDLTDDDLKELSLKVVKGSGTETIAVTPSMVTGYDKTNMTEQTIGFTYGGLTAEQTFKVNVIDQVTDIIIEKPGKLDYQKGEELDLSGGTVTKVMKSGTPQTSEPLTKEMIQTDFDSSKSGVYDVDVTYAGITKPKAFQVTVERYVTKIEITPPSQKTYYYGDSLVLTGGTITVTYDNNTTSTVTMAANMIKESDGSAVNMKPTSYNSETNKANKTLKITYGVGEISETVDYPIEIINTVTKIEIQGTAKPDYNRNEEFQNNLSILVYREEGDPEAVTVKKEWLTNFNTATDGTREATITYTENEISKTAKFEYTVADKITSIEVQGTLTNPTYLYGHDLTTDDLKELSLKVVKGSGTETIAVTPSMVTGYNKTDMTEQTIGFEYGGLTAEQTFKVNVIDQVKDFILVPPADLAYEKGESLDLTGGTVTKVMLSGTPQTPEPLTKEMIQTDFDSSKSGVYDVDVTYAGITKPKAFQVTVERYVTKIEITPPNQTEYYYGDSLVLTGGTITVTYDDNTTSPVTMDANMIKESDGSAVNMKPTSYDSETNKANKTLKITYGVGEISETVDYPIEIINTVTKIEIQGTAKPDYNRNEEFQNNLSILVYREEGDPEAVTVKKEWLTNFDTSTDGTREATITYTENGISKTAKFEYTVADKITSIEVQGTLTNPTYLYGHDLTTDDLKELSLKVVKGSGTETIAVTPSMVTGYNKTNMTEQTIGFTYGGLTAEQTFKVNVIDQVIDFTLDPPDDLSYEKGEALDLTGGTVTKVMLSGTPQTPEPLTQDMIQTVFDSSKSGQQEITVKYPGVTETKTFTVTVADYVTGIEIDAPPKKAYYYGEALGEPGGTITVTYQSGATTTENITASMVTETDDSAFDSNVTFEDGKTIYEKELKVTYQGEETTYTVNIINTMEGIEIIEEQNPEKPKKDYIIGETLEEGISILVDRVQGDKEAIDIASDAVKDKIKIEGFDTTTVGEKTVTIKYTENGIEKEASFKINVTDPISNIELQGTPTVDYLYNEDFKIDNLQLVLHKTNGTETIDVTQDMIKGYDKTKTGEQTVKIEYNGQTVAEIKVNVTDPIEKIEWITKPKGSYVIDEELNVENGKFKITRYSTKTEEIELTKDMVKDFDSSEPGTKTVTVSYEGKTLTYDITIADKVDAIVIKEPPKDDYLYGYDLEKSGTIEVTKASGEKEVIDITPDMITGYKKEQLGTQTVTISYGGKDITYDITVSDYVKEVMITPPSNRTYQYNQDLDLSDSIVTIVMASTPGSSQTIPVTQNMISGYDKTKVDEQKVTITYTADGKDYTKDFMVTVQDEIKSVEFVNSGFETEYLYGHNLDLSTLSFKVTYQGGKEETIPVTTSMVSGYNPNQLGEQEITVAYAGAESKLTVTVKDYLKDISLTPPTKETYQIGEPLALAGGSITEKMASGKNRDTLELTQNMVTGFDSTTPGTKTITVTYEKEGETFTKQFQVVVINPVTAIEVIPPTKTDYQYGEALDLTGGQVIVKLADGTEKPISLTKEMVSGYQSTTPGRQVITVTYIDEEQNTFQGNFTVTVGEDYVVKTEFVKPTKTTYQIGEELDLSGGEIFDIYASGKHGTSTLLTKDMITGFDSTTPGTKQITVTYQGKQYTYSIEVQDKILGINIQTIPDKLNYEKGEELDVTGGILNIIKQSGNITTQEITKDMVSGYNKNQEGLQVITVTYQGFKAQYMVLVEKEEVVTPNEPSDSENNEPDGNPDDSNQGNNNNQNTRPIIIIRPQQTPVENIEPEEPNKEDQVQEQIPNDENKQEIPPIIGSNEQSPPTSGGDGSLLQGLLVGITGILALAGISLLILLYIRERKNVKIYIEEGEEKVLVGKEKLSKHNRVLDLNKYYDKYHEDEYKVVLSKSIAKRLDNKKVNLIVHDKQSSFVVDYKNEACTYKT